MKLFVYGSCQAASYGAALRDHVAQDGVHVSGVDPYESLGECETVLVQSEFRHHTSLAGGFLDVTGKRIILLPTFAFVGLFPDSIVERHDGQALLSPAGVYNSSIALHGFLSGWSVEDTVALFTPQTYRLLEFDRYWTTARAALVADMAGCGLDGEALFDAFVGLGKFAYSTHHQILAVSACVIEAVARLHDLPRRAEPIASADPLAINGDWPIYPGLAEDLDVPHGLSFSFDPPIGGSILKAPIPLTDFVRRSFAFYAALPRDSIRSDRLAQQAGLYARLRPGRRHVYSALPDSAFWRRAVGEVAPAALDPVVQAKWTMEPGERIATAGSCFSQNIARVLRRHDHLLLDCEPAPMSMSAAERARRHYGLFSARYGNIYTARQLHQLVVRALGGFTPVDEAWQRPDGRYVDPFRPQIEPDGFPTLEATRADTGQHLRAVRVMLERMDVLIFTLGLTEAWESTIDGAVFPLAPGVAAGTMDPGRYRFRNFSAAEVRTDLRRTLEAMRDINPRLKVLLTVSPVPMAATYAGQHVLAASTYSKSVLRVAAEEIVADFAFVDYFPSYEMIAGPQAGGAFYAADKRTVSPAGIDHVMARFRHHYLPGGAAEVFPASPSGEAVAAEIAARTRDLCDEERLDRLGAIMTDPR